MKKICPVCGRKEHLGVKASGGEKICYMCSNLTPKYAFETVEKLKSYNTTQIQRREIFSKTNVVKSMMCDSIVVDENNKLFYFGKEKAETPLIYRFDELVGYDIEYAQGQVVTKKKGGLGRAVVGGALFGVAGAVVGASTAKEVTKQQNGPMHYVLHFKCYAGDITKEFHVPPLNADKFFDLCLNEIKEDEETLKSNDVVSDADEILKFKQLLDSGVITQEEFEAKKKQLLGL